MRDGGCEVENDLGQSTEGDEGEWDVSVVVDLAPGCMHTPHTSLCPLDGKAGSSQKLGRNVRKAVRSP